MGTQWGSLKKWCDIWGLHCTWSDKFFMIEVHGNRYIIERRTYPHVGRTVRTKYFLYENGGHVLTSNTFNPLLQYIISRNPMFFQQTPKYFRHLGGDGSLKTFNLNIPVGVQKLLLGLVAYGYACNASEAARIVLSVGTEEMIRRIPALAKMLDNIEPKEKEGTKIFTIKLPRGLYNLLEEAVRKGLAKSKGELIRQALVVYFVKLGLLQ